MIHERTRTHTRAHARTHTELHMQTERCIFPLRILQQRPTASLKRTRAFHNHKGCLRTQSHKRNVMEWCLEHAQTSVNIKTRFQMMLTDSINNRIYKFVKSQGSKKLHLPGSPAILNPSAPSLKQPHVSLPCSRSWRPALLKTEQATVVASSTSVCWWTSAEASNSLTNPSISNWFPIPFRLSPYFWPPFQHQILETVICSPCFCILNGSSLLNS